MKKKLFGTLFFVCVVLIFVAGPSKKADAFPVWFYLCDGAGCEFKNGNYWKTAYFDGKALCCEAKADMWTSGCLQNYHWFDVPIR